MENIVYALIALACFVLIVGIALEMRDYLYAKKLRQGKAVYRLPWRLRLVGWRVGMDVNNHRAFEHRLWYDSRIGKYVSLARLSTQTIKECFKF